MLICKDYADKIHGDVVDGFTDPIAFITKNYPGDREGLFPTTTSTKNLTPIQTFTPLPSPTPTQSTNPAQTEPGGGWIAVHNDNNIWLVRSDSSSLKQITFDGNLTGPGLVVVYANMRWSADGSKLYFVREEADSVLSQFTYQLMQLDMITLQVTAKPLQVLRSENDLFIASNWSLSPDERSIAFDYSINRSDKNGVMVLDLKSAESKEIFNYPPSNGKDFNLINGIAWSSDGKKISVASCYASENPQNMPCTTAIILLATGRVEASLDGTCYWSPQGDSLACGDIDGSSQSNSIKVIDGQSYVLLREIYPDKYQYIQEFNWSPDNHSIVVINNDIPGKNIVYIVNSNSGQSRKIIGGDNYANPVFSPNGQWILVTLRGNKDSILNTIRVADNHIFPITPGEYGLWQTSISASIPTPTLAVTTIPTSQSRLDLKDIKSDLRYLVNLIINNRPEMISSLIDNDGTDLTTGYGREYHSPGYNNAEQVKTEIEESLIDANPVCKGYEESPAKNPDSAMLYIQGLSCKDDTGFCNSQIGNNNNLFFFLFTSDNGGQWHLAAIGPVSKSLSNLIGNLISCP